MNTNKKGRSPYRGIGPSPFVLHAYCITIFIKIPGLASSSQRDNRKEGEEAREREKDLENRVNFLRRGVSHSPLIGRGEGSVHHIFSLKAFTRMESSFIPSKVPTREFLSIRSLSHFQPPQTGESSFEELEVNSLSLFFFRSVSWSYPRL